MLEHLINFLFGQKALQQAAGTGGQQQNPLAGQQQQSNGANFGGNNIAELAQKQAELEFRKKMQLLFSQGKFTGPVQQ